MRYLVASRYASGGGDRRFGPWPAGTEVDLLEADADWVNRDSPGTLRRFVESPEPPPLPDLVPAEVDAEGEPVTGDGDELERATTPARNRQHRPGRNRA